MGQVRRYRFPAPSIVRAAHELARMRRPGQHDQSPHVFFVSAAQDDRWLETETLVRLVALGNLEVGADQGALCVYDVPKREVKDMQAWLERLALHGVDPPMELAVQVLPSLQDGAALVATIVAPDPPYVIGHPFTSLRRGECWVFRQGSFRLATRADLDVAYAHSAPPHGTDGEALDGLLDASIGDLKDRLLLGFDRPNMALLTHRLALQVSRGWRRHGQGSAETPPVDVAAAADRILTVGVAGVSASISRLWQAAARALRSIYLLSLDARQLEGAAIDPMVPGEAAVARYFVLAALATHRRDWNVVGVLASESVPGRIRGEFPLADHPLFVPGSVNATRTLHDFFDDAMNLGRTEPAWLEEFGDEDLVANAVCQWDLLTAVASPGTSSHYPNFARFEKARVAPVVGLCKRDPAKLAPLLGEDAAPALDAFLVRLEAEIGADFATFAPWWAWGHTFEDLA